ncbi:MAG: hypothetical protein GY757_25040 [bacterium]|nr:hypothetical protein [bacterium]
MSVTMVSSNENALAPDSGTSKGKSYFNWDGMNKNGWFLFPIAFFLLVNFSVSPVKQLFFSRLIYFLFLISLFLFLGRFDLGKILRTVTAGISTIIFSYGILQKYLLFPLYLKNLNIDPDDNFYSLALITRIKSGRIFSIFELPTLYAIICAIFILFILHYLLRSSGKMRLFWLLLLALGTFNLLLSQSFGGVIYLTVGILFYLLLSGILKFKYLAPVIMVFSLFFFITVVLRFSEAKKLEPVTLRFSNWVQAYRVLDSSPAWGVGLGNYESTISYFTKPREAKSIYAHNFFLQFISETGVILPLFLLVFLVLMRKKLKPPAKDADGENENENENENVLYLSAFFILLAYNIIDIGFYFFAAGVAGAVVLSQLYRSPVVTPARNGFKLNLIVLILLSLLLITGNIADNYRKEGDFLLNQRSYTDAEGLYKKSTSLNPFNFKALCGCATTTFYTGRHRETEYYVEKILALYPDSSFAHFLKSKLQLEKGHIFKAFYHASKAYRKNVLNSHYGKWYVAMKKNLENMIQKVKGVKGVK